MFDVTDRSGNPISAGEAVRRFNIGTPDIDDDCWVDPDSASWALCPDGSLIILWGEGEEKAILRPPKQCRVRIRLDLYANEWGQTEPPEQPNSEESQSPEPDWRFRQAAINLSPDADLDASLDIDPIIGTYLMHAARRAYMASYLPSTGGEKPRAVEGAPYIELNPDNWKITPSVVRLRIKFTIPKDSPKIEGMVGLFLVDKDDVPLMWMSETHSSGAYGVVDTACIHALLHPDLVGLPGSVILQDDQGDE
jgi:hypothetical protein